MGSSSLRDPGLGELPGDAAGGLLLSPVLKELSEWALSATPTRQCPGYASGHAEPKPRYPRTGTQHSQPGETPNDAGAGRSPGAELAAAAGKRRRRRSRAGAGGGSRAAERRDAAVPGLGADGSGCGASGCAGLPPAGPGLRRLRGCKGCRTAGPRSPLSVQILSDVIYHSRSSCMKFPWERMDFVSLLLVFFSAVAVSRAQVQQEPSAETSEGTGINLTCSHPNIKSDEYIHWNRQLPGRAPTFLVSAVKGTKNVPDPAGQVSVSADRRSSGLCLTQPLLGDAAV